MKRLGGSRETVGETPTGFGAVQPPTEGCAREADDRSGEDVLCHRQPDHCDRQSDAQSDEQGYPHTLRYRLVVENG